jgi:Uma2 family endonuclease
MNVHSIAQMDKAAFLAWAEGREGRYELVESRVVMMVGVSLAHGLICGNLYTALRNQLSRAEWMVLTDFGVDVGPRTLRYPDVLVAKASKSYKDFTATEPVFIAEVLSPSTATVDLGDKVTEYLQLSSLEAYVVFAQDEPKAWVRVRVHGNFPASPTVLSGRDAVLNVQTLALNIKMSDVYEGVEDTAQQ